MSPGLRAFGSAAMLGAALLAGGCAETGPRVTVSETVQRTFAVESVDYANRIIVLRDERGPVTVRAGEEVRNLREVRVGDRVVVDYREAIAAELVKPGTGVAGVKPSVTMERSGPNAPPYLMMTERVRMTVRVNSAAADGGEVEVTGPRGQVRRVRVVDDAAREFVRGLKAGDEVEVTFTEASAIRLERAK